ncbi:glycosyltransferase family 4 protein [Ovoidimarina sediminis]|uniref:glycosyltransferase family 4 protein n=1 Tax=Ovoidimarina sediminis TaxID=3079856 RepID=UPI00290FBB4C|nr:glycosyltransferase family 4 protein [Rhodophyticola sp. MJ-SS7]MDU8943180.1 glycosyltransferase family 4 protein [Rhodophyticola sp. MJ-SS7]
MRIVYVSADRGIPIFGEKGASIHIQEMMRAFGALGHEVRAVTARRGSGDSPGLSVEEVAQVTAGTERASKERAAMTQARAIEARLLALYREWPFDMIYERYSLWSAAGCRAGTALGVPVITEVNAPLVLEQAAFRTLVCEAEARAIEAEVFARSTALAAVSGQVREYVIRAGGEAARVHVTRNAVDTWNFRPDVPPADLPDVPDGAFVIGFTGSLKMWHGVDTLLDAFRLFREREPRAHLLICGDGPKRGWIEGFVAGAELQKAVTLAGWVDHARLPAMIARMDVATAPYPGSEAHYFSPLKLFEYLAMGRPVVASDIGQTSELLKGSAAAILLPPGDARALAESFAYLERNPEVCGRMAMASAAEGARHDWTDNAARVLALATGASVAA